MNIFPILLRPPYDNEKPLNYAITYLWSAAFIYSIFSCALAADNLYSWLIHNISAQLFILQSRFSNICKLLYGDNNEDEFLRQYLILTREHCLLLNVTMKFNEIYYQIFFAEITLSIFQMCFLIYQSTNFLDPTALPFCICGIVAITVQLLIYCFGGEHLITAVSRTSIKYNMSICF